MQRMFLELRSGRTPAMTRLSTKRFPSLKMDFKVFSGEPEDWNTLSRVHQALVMCRGINGEIMICSSDFNRSDFDPQTASSGASELGIIDDQVSTCKGVKSPGEARPCLGQHYRASGLKERRAASP